MLLERTKAIPETPGADQEPFLNHSGGIRYLLGSGQESALVERCVAGDDRARSELFHACRAMLHRLVYRFVGPVHDIDDLLQDIYVELFQSLKRFRGDSKLSTWLYRICLNVCMTYLRRKTQRRELFVPHEFGDTERADVCEGSDGERVISSRRAQQAIAEALLKVPPKKRMVLVLHDIEGRTMEEIAEIIRRPVGTVKSRLFNARGQLRKLLEDSVDRCV